MTENYEYKTTNAWKITDKDCVFSYAKSYMDFLNHAKTEREAVATAVQIAEQHGFIPLSDKKSLQPGDKVYITHRNKNILLAVIGKNPVSDGIRMVASHIDCPRLDLKQQPLHEEKELAYLRTHYYGGVKKYQWATLPLALHGVVIKTDGTRIDIVIGEDEIRTETAILKDMSTAKEHRISLGDRFLFDFLSCKVEDFNG